MIPRAISTGTVHNVPKDLEKALRTNPKSRTPWEDITPLARNEWICWVENAKKENTRLGRIQRVCSQLAEGDRRPCCFAGCPHRKKASTKKA